MILKNIEKKEHNTAVFTVAADSAEFEKAVNGAYLKNKKDVYIPGFRKGKAPRQVIEGMYGKEVFYQDAMDDLAPEAFELGVKEGELRVVGQPRISDVNVTDEPQQQCGRRSCGKMGTVKRRSHMDIPPAQRTQVV